MRIGISIITHSNQSIWENGMGQNIIFLTQTLLSIDFVEKVIFIDISKTDESKQEFLIDQIKIQILNQKQATDEVDLIIELAGALDTKWLKLQRSRGKKVVYYNVGQPYVGLIENSIFNKSGVFHSTERCDEVWVLEKDIQFIPMIKTMMRCPVKIVPYLWSPYFIESRVNEIKKQGYDYNWNPEEKEAKIAIFEPNISVIKNCLIPMLAADHAYREQKEKIKMMHVLNTWHIKDHLTYLHLAKSLSIVKDNKACFHDRHDIAGFMVQNANMVVSHQWCNNQNYLYLDVIYGNYPLIHNSEWLNKFNVGYFYHDFDINEASKKIILSLEYHSENLEIQKMAKIDLYNEIDPYSSKNIKQYRTLLSELIKDI